MSAYFWNNPTTILFAILAVLILDNLWSMYLLLREIAVVTETRKVPDVLRQYLPQEIFNRMRAYKLHKSWFSLVNTFIFVLVFGCLELFFGFYAVVWYVASKCAFAKWMQQELFISVIYVLLLGIYLTLKALPGALYERFCIPKLHKRRKVSLARRICGEICDTVVAVVTIVLVVMVIVSLCLALGIYSFVGLFCLSCVMTVLLILLMPVIIIPCIGKRVPFENMPLKADLEKLTESIGFPFRQVYLIKVNDPNTGSNAFFYGSCCLKRIVIFDTVLYNRGLKDTSLLEPDQIGKGLINSQVVAVVAHELGHWHHGHFYKAIIMFKVHVLITLLLFGICYPHGPIYQAVGFEKGVQPVLAGFIIIFGFVLTPYMTFSNFFMLSVTRYFEYQADEFAFELGYARDLRHALLKLYADNLSFPISDSCYASWRHTHPTMLDRLRTLEELETGMAWTV
ncbi:CAAX prenyl protease 1 homolog [Scaptodrosophila lebanonensis]|uniref:CAAX prenyl protease n=1 Tax=Drosophila lebanonensis TaxID=7225 RepID=A0A6J2U849_DROLE|nr:CAAX prenyl protease 1 homolog [Scaptodrosophila lebanonensis]